MVNSYMCTEEPKKHKVIFMVAELLKKINFLSHCNYINNDTNYYKSRMNSDICKLRIDFESMTLSDPEDFTTSGTLATGVLLALEVWYSFSIFYVLKRIEIKVFC